MTSMLASFAWRKANGETSMPTAPSGNFDISPGVSASSSGETIGLQASEDSMVPQTPEGLRSRKSANSIREELGLPRRRILDWDPQPNRPIAQCMQESPARSVLPPMKPYMEESPTCFGLPPVLPSSSMPSPQVSTSSFYTRSSHASHSIACSPNLVVGQAKTAVGALLASDDVAQSPNLAIGQAKTAVGALLAMSDHQRSFHDTANSIHSTDSILPPRKWDQNEDDIGKIPYESLNESNSYSSMASQSDIHEVLESEGESFSHASPSSNYFRNSTNVKYNKKKLETSFSRAFLMDHSKMSREPYDFQNIVENSLYVVPKHTGPSQDLNVSGISQSTKGMESLHSLADDVIDEDMFSNCDEDMIGSDKQDINSLDISKAQGQRYNRDDLLFSSLERLQDNFMLIINLLDRLALVEDNFFTGFSKQNRDSVCHVLEKIVKEKPSSFQKSSEGQKDFEQALGFCSALIRIAVPVSEKPNKMQSSTIGILKQGRWKCVPGFRAAIGLEEEPKSPETIRGGDTSLFSLPSETMTDLTPHTSNVSVTTTITSAFSPDKDERIQGFHYHRKNLRQSLESIVNLFHKLGATCTKLLSSAGANSIDSISAAEEITRLYLQLQTLPVDNLEVLVDSFELDILSLPISRMISEDEEENEDTSNLPNILPVMKSLTTPSSSDMTMQLVPQTMRIFTEPLSMNIVEENYDDAGTHLFSPGTVDMASIEMSTFDHNRMDEDLRRTVGSFDSEDVQEDRDSPPLVASTIAERQLQPNRMNLATKKKAKKRSFWKKRFSRKKAAE